MPEMNTTNPRDKLMADLKLVIADAEELLKLTSGQAGDKVAEMRTRIQARMEQAKADLASAQETAVLRAKDAGRAADAYVHESPWKAVGIAAGVGLVVGLLISRR
jgi:ElaB/YqjD/DUF883 family membrane-anchored ribosome-binding protein